jgi:NAD(P)-dependent dehydrogenase (short-subunit alcohol dehydrogenase family)
MQKTVLITGVSSGIGLSMTKKLLSEGFQVIGSVRSQASADALQHLGAQFTPLIFDICREDQLKAAKEELRSKLGERHLDFLVNNAGSADMAPLLYMPLDDFREQLNTLVVGQLAVIQHFYDLLLPRTDALAAGKIINISSTSGVDGNAYFGGYVAGKHALEGLSKCLRKELERYKIQVVVVAPSNIKTPIWAKQTESAARRYQNTDYYESLLGLLKFVNETLLKSAMTSEEFADAFFDIINLPEPAPRYTVAKSKSKRLPFAPPKVRFFAD